MAELKREYVVPLRRKTRNAPKWRRSKRAVSVLKEFIQKHMKTEEVIICAELNEHIWSKGAKNPPGKVEVIAIKNKFGKDEKTIVNLLSIGLDKQLKEYKTETPITETKKTESAKDKVEVKDAEVKEVVKEKKVAEPKKETTKKKEVKKDE